MTLSFEPYGSRIVVLRGDSDRAGGETARTARQSIELRSNWAVTLGSTRSIGPVDLPYEWASTAEDRFFSGTATFRRTVDVPSHPPDERVVLDFGDGAPVGREALPGGTMRGNSFAALIAAPVREAATILLNGRRAGSIWAPPYRLDVTNAVRAGANDLRIDVYNTAINRLAEGGHLPDVGAVTERYGQRFRLQDVDNLQPIPSGILAVPRLVIER
jgi:hypothetical protein